MSSDKNTWQILSRVDMQKIHDASVALLEDPGIYVDHDGFLDALEVRGATIDRTRHVAQIPASVSNQATGDICKAPCIYTSGDSHRDDASEGVLQENVPRKFQFRFGGSGLEVLSDDMRSARTAEYHDLERVVRFGNGHPRIATIGGPPVQYAFERDGSVVPPELRPIAGMRYAAKHSSKLGWNEIANVEDVDFAVRLGELVAGSPESYRDDPVFLCVKCSISPLRLGAETASILYELSQRNLPVGIAPMPLAGGTSPVTPASAILVTNAEILGGMVAVWSAGSISTQEHLPLSAVMDMQTAVASFSNPNAVLQDCGVAQLWSSFYGIPVHAATDYIDAKFPGYQSGIERGFKIATSGLAGSFYPSIGQLKSGLVCSPVQACLDIEAFDWMSHFMRGVEVNDDTLAVDLFRDRGIGGHFLDADHTVEKFREEIFLPEHADRTSDQTNDMVDSARAEVESILSETPVFTRDAHLCSEIDALYEAEVSRRFGS